MDRPEDVEPSLDNGRVYVACTNNTDRGKVGKEGPTEPNPRNGQQGGPRRRDHRAGGDHTGRHLRAGTSCSSAATRRRAGTYFGG